MNIPVQRIARPRGDAPLICRFVSQLTARSGVRVGARRSPTVLGQWQIVWHDGPNVMAMRRHAMDLGTAVVGVDLHQLTWHRTSRANPTELQLAHDDEPADPRSTPAA